MIRFVFLIWIENVLHSKVFHKRATHGLLQNVTEWMHYHWRSSWLTMFILRMNHVWIVCKAQMNHSSLNTLQVLDIVYHKYSQCNSLHPHQVLFTMISEFVQNPMKLYKDIVYCSEFFSLKPTYVVKLTLCQWNMHMHQNQTMFEVLLYGFNRKGGN